MRHTNSSGLKLGINILTKEPDILVWSQAAHTDSMPCTASPFLISTKISSAHQFVSTWDSECQPKRTFFPKFYGNIIWASADCDLAKGMVQVRLTQTESPNYKFRQPGCQGEEGYLKESKDKQPPVENLGLFWLLCSQFEKAGKAHFWSQWLMSSFWFMLNSQARGWVEGTGQGDAESYILGREVGVGWGVD